MGRLANIAIGWGKAVGLLEVSAEDKALSDERLKVCESCPNAKESQVLMLLKGGAEHVDSLYCTLCSCPVNEKSLVAAEKCPAGKWKQ